MTLDLLENERADYRVKSAIDVELILNDGARLTGSIFIGNDERVQDSLNHPNLFFPLRLENQEILLVSKTSVAICKPLDRL